MLFRLIEFPQSGANLRQQVELGWARVSARFVHVSFDVSLSSIDLLMFSLNCTIFKSFLNLWTFSSRQLKWRIELARCERIESCNLFWTTLNWAELNDTLESRNNDNGAIIFSSWKVLFDFEDKFMLCKLRFMARLSFKNVLFCWKHSPDTLRLMSLPVLD